ncbi:MAG: DPP IV N-terminal domain-containing protein [Thermomicrobiales bacterium]
MKRVLVAAALIVSLLGIAGWHASVLAQTPVGGEVRTVTLPHGRAAAMSPNGQYLAAVTPPDTALCVYDVATMAEVSCADLSGLSAGIRTEDIVWSPDSTRIAFSEHAFRLFVDGDLWVMDAATGSLTNLTDDGYVGRILESGSDNSEQFFFDVAPAWTPDSQFITFSRTEYAGPGLARNTIAQVPASGGSVEELAEISDIPGAWYFKGQWSPDGQQLYYSFNDSDPDSTDTGIWVYQRATGEIRKLAMSDDAELGPLVLMQVSPAGNRLLAYYPMALMQSAYWGKSVLRFVDPVTGDVSQVPDPAPESEVFEGTWLATFSPDGAYLLQAVGVSSASRAFWVTDLASGVSTRVTGEIADAMPVEYALGPVWGADGTVFIAQALDGAIFFSIEGVGLDVAQPEDTSTPVASHVVENGDAGAPVGGAVRQVELPEGRAIAMSPDGRYLAATVPPQTSLCVYDVATMAEVSCADLSVLNTMLRIEDVIWSPDSTRLAFSEQTFVTYKDGDLWVMDAATGELTNLTDDHYDGAIIDLHDDTGDAEFFADVAPAWTPDGQFITFSRSSSGEGGVSTNVIAQVSATGGEVATLAPVSEAPGVFYYRGQWSPDGTRFYYSVTNLDLSHPDNGIWTYDPATGATALLARSDDAEFGPLVLREVSPAGDRLLAYYPSATSGFVVLQRSPLRLVDANTGALSAVPQPPAETDLFEGTWIATFSPDGQYLLQAVGLDSGARDFWVTHLETGASTEVAADLESAVPVAFGLGPVWGTDGTVFVAWNVIGAYFFPIDGAGLATTASPVTEQSTQASTVFAPGDTALTTGMTPIFAAPDANATVVHILAPNNTVQILGEPVTNEQGTWYPVLEPETQIIGYVQATQLGQPT